MRIYRDFRDANNELRRDLAELGTLVHPQTMQDKQIQGDPNYLTKEYQNMIYAVSQPRLEDLNPSQPWADAEFQERIDFVSLNGPRGKYPEAWKLRPEVWEEFSKDFSYTYGERYRFSLWQTVGELKKHPDSRQLFISVWSPLVDPYKLGKHRVPCSIGYWLANRDGKLMITYLQRSADIVTHFENDQYLTHKLQRFIAEEAGLEVGRFTHWIGSLHAYRKDLGDIF